MTTLEIAQLSKAFQGRSVLDRLSLEVQDGELLALLGPSGAGKSTLLKLIAGIEEPDAGEIRFNGTSILDRPAHQRGAVLMFQGGYLFPFLNVAANIGFGLKVQGASKQHIRSEVSRLLELVELPGIELANPRQLSGGQAQRVALARALSVRPQILMLDEPLSNLDPQIRQSLQASIRRIQSELRITTLLVTHDLSEALAMSDRTALLLTGRLAALEPPSVLFNRPPSRAAAQFVGITAFFEGRLAGSQLETAHGRLAVPVAAALPRQTSFAIRPERIELHHTAGPARWASTIQHATYRGEYTEYLVTLNSQKLTVKAAQQPAFSPGATVFLSFPPEHLFEVFNEITTISKKVVL